jgi:hypothetical protein
MICVGVEAEFVIKLTTGHKFGRVHLALSGRMHFWISSMSRCLRFLRFEFDRCGSEPFQKVDAQIGLRAPSN